jgi:hypothetical protein
VCARERVLEGLVPASSAAISFARARSADPRESRCVREKARARFSACSAMASAWRGVSTEDEVMGGHLGRAASASCNRPQAAAAPSVRRTGAFRCSLGELEPPASSSLPIGHARREFAIASAASRSIAIACT